MNFKISEHNETGSAMRFIFRFMFESIFFQAKGKDFIITIDQDGNSLASI